MGVFHPLSPALMTIHRNLKHAFDPAGIFNPGRLYNFEAGGGRWEAGGESSAKA